MIPEPTDADLQRNLSYLYEAIRVTDVGAVWIVDMAHSLIRRCHAAESQLAAMTAARDKLQAFKDWVHGFLDTHGVPHHPPGTHGAAGCRIGDRMDWLMAQLADLRSEVERLKLAIRTHRDQKADDRCIEDDDRLYEVLGDGVKCDRRVGDKGAMLRNCQRFIERRCEGGGWPTYAELEAEVERLRADLARPVSKEGRAMNRRKGRMVRASELKKEIDGIMEKFGDTCFYVTGLAWGSVALWQQADVDELEAALLAKDPDHA